MTPPPDSPVPHDHGVGGQEAYSLEVTARISGVSSESILLYQEHGLVRPPADSSGFDDEAIHTLRRIEHLRQTCEANLNGLRLILQLMDQVEQLELALRTRR